MNHTYIPDLKPAKKRPWILRFFVTWLWLLGTIAWFGVLVACVIGAGFSIMGIVIVTHAWLTGNPEVDWYISPILFVVTTMVGLATVQIEPWKSRLKETLIDMFL